MNRNEIYEDEIDIKELFGTLKRYKKSIFLIVVLSFLAGFAYTYYAKKIYQAKAVVEIGSNKKNSINSEDILQEALGGGNADIDTQVAVIKSRYTILEALNKVNMTTQMWGINKFYKKIEFYKNYPFEIKLEKGKEILFQIEIVNNRNFRLKTKIADGEKTIEYNKMHAFGKKITTPYFILTIFKKAKEFQYQKYQFILHDKLYFADSLKKSLTVQPVSKKANVIDVSFEDSVALRAKEFTNALVKSYIEQNIKRKTQEATQVLAFIDSQLKIIQGNLKKAENALQKFKEKQKSINISQDALELSKILSEYENEQTILKMKIQILQRLLFQIKKGKNLESLTLAGIGFDDQNIMDLIGKLQEALIKKRELLKDYTPAHPEVRKVSSQIIQLKAIIYKSIRSALSLLKTKEALLARNIAKYQKKIQRLPKAQQNYINLERRFSFNDKFYTYLLEKRTETEIKKAATVSQNRILENALLPLKPIKPKKKLIWLITVILGLILGIIQAIIRDFFDNTIKSIHDIEKVTNAPVIGTIPHSKQAKKDRILYVVNKPKSAIAESFRALRTNLTFMLERESKVIAVTSTVAEEGKTTVSANLALMQSMLKKKVIILNFDLRKPTLHQIFNRPNNKGLSNYLANQVKIEDIILHTDFENLDIIPSGPVPPNPGELIASNKTRTLIEFLKIYYDLIILDSPPIGLVADSKLLFQYSTTLLYIVRADYSKKEFLYQIDALYKEKLTKHFGIVLNDIKNETKGYGGYGYYEE